MDILRLLLFIIVPRRVEVEEVPRDLGVRRIEVFRFEKTGEVGGQAHVFWGGTQNNGVRSARQRAACSTACSVSAESVVNRSHSGHSRTLLFFVLSGSASELLMPSLD